MLKQQARWFFRLWYAPCSTVCNHNQNMFDKLAYKRWFTTPYINTCDSFEQTKKIPKIRIKVIKRPLQLQTPRLRLYLEWFFGVCLHILRRYLSSTRDHGQSLAVHKTKKEPSFAGFGWLWLFSMYGSLNKRIRLPNYPMLGMISRESDIIYTFV